MVHEESIFYIKFGKSFVKFSCIGPCMHLKYEKL